MGVSVLKTVFLYVCGNGISVSGLRDRMKVSQGEYEDDLSYANKDDRMERKLYAQTIQKRKDHRTIRNKKKQPSIHNEIDRELAATSSSSSHDERSVSPLSLRAEQRRHDARNKAGRVVAKKTANKEAHEFLAPQSESVPVTTKTTSGKPAKSPTKKTSATTSSTQKNGSTKLKPGTGASSPTKNHHSRKTFKNNSKAERRVDATSKTVDAKSGRGIVRRGVTEDFWIPCGSENEAQQNTPVHIQRRAQSQPRHAKIISSASAEDHKQVSEAIPAVKNTRDEDVKDATAEENIATFVEDRKMSDTRTVCSDETTSVAARDDSQKTLRPDELQSADDININDTTTIPSSSLTTHDVIAGTTKIDETVTSTGTAENDTTTKQDENEDLQDWCEVAQPKSSEKTAETSNDENSSGSSSWFRRFAPSFLSGK